MNKPKLERCPNSEGDKRSCYTCKNFAALKSPYERSDGAVIYGYCFKEGDKDYSPNMGKGLPVFIDGGSCKVWKKRKESTNGKD